MPVTRGGIGAPRQLRYRGNSHLFAKVIEDGYAMDFMKTLLRNSQHLLSSPDENIPDFA